MMKLKVGKKEYELKFGYKATIKSKIISKMMDIETDEVERSVEDLMSFIPEVLLVALQKNHSDEYGYDIESEEGREEALKKVFDLTEDFCDEGGDVFELYRNISQEMAKESFLKSLFQQEKAKAAKQK